MMMLTSEQDRARLEARYKRLKILAKMWNNLTRQEQTLLHRTVGRTVRALAEIDRKAVT
jgi:hypothetical protein